MCLGDGVGECDNFQLDLFHIRICECTGIQTKTKSRSRQAMIFNIKRGVESLFLYPVAALNSAKSIRFKSSDRFNDLWHDLKRISHDSIVGGFEKGRLRILVDDHDDLTAVDPCQMLDGA